MRSLPVLAAGVLIGLAFHASPPARAADPISDCAAIAFRPVPVRPVDGDQDAGLYKSRFGRIEVKAAVKGGQVQRYFVRLDGHALTPVRGALPATVEMCAKAKRLGGAAEPVCAGDRLAVVLDRAGTQRYVLLYAHQVGGTWHFCSAGTAP